MNSPNKPRVGIAGGAGSGKDTVAKLFTEFGYTHVSSSDIVREELAAMGETLTRANQTKIANLIRKQRGGSYFVIESLRRAQQGNVTAPVVVSGIYAPIEGQYIHSIGGSIVYVHTSPEVGESDSIARFQRILERSDGDRDKLTIEEFNEAESRENSGLNDETNLAALQRMADFLIINSSSTPIESLRQLVGDIVIRLDTVNSHG